MKIGILCGLAKSAQLKAEHCQNAIINCGHEVRIFSRGPLPFWSHRPVISPDINVLTERADKADLDLYIACNDNLGDIVSGLNAMRGLPHVPYGATHKTNLDKLSDKLQVIPSWDHIDNVPMDIPIFVKPNTGSGSVGGEPWSYKQFDSIAHFKQFLDTIEGGYGRFEYAQSHLGMLGKSIFQKHVPNDGWIYMHYLNDGVGQLWMESWCAAPDPDAICTNRICTEDRYDFVKNIPEGITASFQAFPNEEPDGKPYLFDFNVRCSAYWSSLYKYVCPDFFNTYFNNLLNRKQDKYDWKCQEFTMDPYGPEHLKVYIEDYPASGLNCMQSLIMK